METLMKVPFRKRLALYVDATIPNYVFNDHVPDKQCASKKLFDEINQGKFTLLISPVLLEELDPAPEPKRTSMLNLVKNFQILEPSSQIELLAKDYVAKEIIPPKNLNDARHIAFASFYGLDVIISYNFEHIVCIRTIDGVMAINLLHGYSTPKIVIPEEVISVDEGI